MPTDQAAVVRCVPRPAVLIALTALVAAVLPLVAAPAPAGAASGTQGVSAAARSDLELVAEAHALAAHNAQRRAGQVRDGVRHRDVAAAGPLVGWTDMMTVSRAWADQISSRSFRHNPDYHRQYGYWSSAAENIAWSRPAWPTDRPPSRSQVRAAVDGIMRGWWNSAGHRTNWMSPSFDHVSVGVSLRTVAGRWELVAVANFRAARGTPGTPWHAFPADGRLPPNEPGASRFRDVATSHVFHDAVLALADAGVTRGCGDGRFCPDDTVTRGQMAAFLTRALRLPRGRTTHTDTRGHVFAADIAALADAGITKGCGDGRFCPDDTVTRGQMAAFLHRSGVLTG